MAKIDRRHFLAVGASLAVTPTFVARASPAKAKLTTKDCIDTARLSFAKATGNPVFMAPGTSRYAMLLVKGDMASDSLTARVLVGDLSSLSSARAISKATFEMSGLGPAGELVWVFANPLIWLPDNEWIALRWPDINNVIQLAAVNSQTGAVRFITKSATHVRNAYLSATNGLLFTASPPDDRTQVTKLRNQGYAVDSADMISALDERGYKNVNDAEAANRVYYQARFDDAPIPVFIQTSKRVSTVHHFGMVSSFHPTRNSLLLRVRHRSHQSHGAIMTTDTSSGQSKYLAKVRTVTRFGSNATIF
jgi:hypothetical protein